MKATELILALQNVVNNHGDFDVKINIHDEEYSYDMTIDDDWDVSFQWNDENNGVSKANSCYGGVIYAELHDYDEEYEDEEDEY